MGSILTAIDTGVGYWIIYAHLYACSEVYFAPRHPFPKAICHFQFIVYKVRRPVPFPCFGVLKHILLASVADVAIEQGYLQSLFGVYSVRIDNVGVRRPPSDDVQIQGVANPHAFSKAVLVQLSNMRGELFSRQVSALEDISTPKIGHSFVPLASPSKLKHDSFPHFGEMAVLQKLEEVGSSVKRLQTLIEEQNLQFLDEAN